MATAFLAPLMLVLLACMCQVHTGVAGDAASFRVYSNNVVGPTNPNITDVIATEGAVTASYASPNNVPNEHTITPDNEYLRFYVGLDPGSEITPGLSGNAFHAAASVYTPNHEEVPIMKESHLTDDDDRKGEKGGSDGVDWTITDEHFVREPEDTIGMVVVELGGDGIAMPEPDDPDKNHAVDASVLVFFACYTVGTFVVQITISPVSNHIFPAPQAKSVTFYFAKTCTGDNPRAAFAVDLVSDLIFEAARNGKPTDLFAPDAIYAIHVISDSADVEDTFRVYLTDSSAGNKQLWKVAAIDFDESIVDVAWEPLNANYGQAVPLPSGGSESDVGGVQLSYACKDREGGIETVVSMSLHLNKKPGGKPFNGITLTWVKQCGPPLNFMLSIWFFVWLLAISVGVTLLVCNSSERRMRNGGAPRGSCVDYLDRCCISCKAFFLGPFGVACGDCCGDDGRVGTGSSGGGAGTVTNEELYASGDGRSALLRRDYGRIDDESWQVVDSEGGGGTPMVPLGATRDKLLEKKGGTRSAAAAARAVGGYGALADE